MEMFFHFTENSLSEHMKRAKREPVFMIDKEKIEAAVRMLPEGIGEDVEREGLLETPSRIS